MPQTTPTASGVDQERLRAARPSDGRAPAGVEVPCLRCRVGLTACLATRWTSTSLPDPPRSPLLGPAREVPRASRQSVARLPLRPRLLTRRLPPRTTRQALGRRSLVLLVWRARTARRATRRVVSARPSRTGSARLQLLDERSWEKSLPSLRCPRLSSLAVGRP